MASRVTDATVLEGESFIPLAYVRHPDGSTVVKTTDLTTGSGGSVKRYLFDEADVATSLTISDASATLWGESEPVLAGGVGIGTGTTTVIFDTLQTDYGWSAGVDATGYNYRSLLAVENYQMEGGKTYRYEVKMTFGDTSASGNDPVYKIWLAWRIKVISVSKE